MNTHTAFYVKTTTTTTVRTDHTHRVQDELARSGVACLILILICVFRFIYIYLQLVVVVALLVSSILTVSKRSFRAPQIEHHVGVTVLRTTIYLEVYKYLGTPLKCRIVPTTRLRISRISASRVPMVSACNRNAHKQCAGKGISTMYEARKRESSTQKITSPNKARQTKKKRGARQ